MHGTRRFSQAISEGDGISLIAEVLHADDAGAAERHGAEAIVVRGELARVREATDLPILWCGSEPVTRAAGAGADAYLVVVREVDGENERLERLDGEVRGLGLDAVVEVRDEDELRLALERVDPELVLLTARGTQGADAIGHVLGLLPDVPAGKLAIARLDAPRIEEVDELERAGVDGVVVPAAAVPGLLRAQPRQA